MNKNLNNSFLLLTSMALVACGGDSSDDNNDNAGEEHEHEHSALVTQQNSAALSVLEEGAPESITDLQANGASLLLASTGEHAAIITDGLVQFIESHSEEEEEEGHDEEEHELPELSEFTVSGTSVSVVNTVGHFSVLVDGDTTFVPYEAPAAEVFALDGDQSAPALLLDEEHNLVLAFVGGNAVVYEGTVASEVDTFTCGTVNSVAHVGEFAVVSCDSSNFSVKVEEGVEDHTIEIADLGIQTSVEWASRAGVYVGKGEDDKFYVLEEDEETETLELEGGAGFDAPEGMCDWAIDSVEAKLFTLTSSQLIVREHDGSVHVTLGIDESQGSNCGDFVLAPANNAVFVMDNAGAVLYEIDIDEGASLYHIHGRETMTVTDVAAAVVFHEIGSTEHDHDH